MQRAMILVIIACGYFFGCATTPSSSFKPDNDAGNTRKAISVLADNGQTFSSRKAEIKKRWNGLKGSSSLQGGLKALNFIRFLAGLPDDVELKDEYNNLAQHGSELNAAHGAIGHRQPKPAGMDEAFYALALKGIGSSNLSFGHATLTDAVINGWTEDSDRSNIDRLGHRRWILNPSMRYTGFGQAGTFMSMYSFDKSRTDPVNYQAICFPSGAAFPNDFFKGHWAWNITLNPALYQSPDFNTIVITITEKSSGRTWNRSKNEGYFTIDRQGFGVSNCIIFQLSDISEYNGTYTVEVKGLKDKEGNSCELKYSTTFFAIDPSAKSSSRSDPIVDLAWFSGLYLNGWHENLFSAGLPLQLGIRFNFANMALNILGEGGVGVGSSSFSESLLLEWHYGGMGEFYFPGKKIGLGFGYGIVDSALLSDYSTKEAYTPELFNTTYMRFAFILHGKKSKTALYAQLYGDNNWGFGLQWGMGK